jgi:hypothetical protein
MDFLECPTDFAGAYINHPSSSREGHRIGCEALLKRYTSRLTRALILVNSQAENRKNRRLVASIPRGGSAVGLRYRQWTTTQKAQFDAKPLTESITQKVHREGSKYSTCAGICLTRDIFMIIRQALAICEILFSLMPVSGGKTIVIGKIIECKHG